MKQIVLNIPENKYKSFIRLVKTLDYVIFTKDTVQDKTQHVSERFRNKIPKEIAAEMHKQLEEIRNEWESDI